MLFTRKTAAEKRQALGALMDDGRLHQFPGAFNPLCAQLIERKGFPGVYISGAVLSAYLCLPDIGIATLTEFADRGRQIGRATDLPAIIDIDTGFGEPMSAARTVRLMEEAGISGCHIEDQRMPKRCGHLDGKDLVGVEEMVQKIGASAGARLDKSFCLIARSDARAVEGLDKAIDRMKAYVRPENKPMLRVFERHQFVRTPSRGPDEVLLELDVKAAQSVQVGAGAKIRSN